MLCWKSSPFSTRSLTHAWPKTASDQDRFRRSAHPPTNRSQPDPALVSSPACPHPFGDRPGARTQTLALQTQCDESTVRRTCHRYQRLGLSGLLDSPTRSGRPIAISPPATHQIVELACLEPVAEGLHITHWTSEDLADQAVVDGIVPAVSAGRSAGSCMTSTCNPTAPATGGLLTWMLSSSSGPRRSSGATPTPTVWSSRATG